MLDGFVILSTDTVTAKIFSNSNENCNVDKESPPSWRKLVVEVIEISEELLKIELILL